MATNRQRLEAARDRAARKITGLRAGATVCDLREIITVSATPSETYDTGPTECEPHSRYVAGDSTVLIDGATFAGLYRPGRLGWYVLTRSDMGNPPGALLFSFSDNATLRSL